MGVPDVGAAVLEHARTLVVALKHRPSDAVANYLERCGVRDAVSACQGLSAKPDASKEPTANPAPVKEKKEKEGG